MKLTVLIFLLVSVLVLCSGQKKDKKNKNKGKYVVTPGVDVPMAQASTWSNTYTSPANLYFGPRPYVVGWVGAGPRPSPPGSRPRPTTLRPPSSFPSTFRPPTFPTPSS